LDTHWDASDIIKLIWNAPVDKNFWPARLNTLLRRRPWDAAGMISVLVGVAGANRTGDEQFWTPDQTCWYVTYVHALRMHHPYDLVHGSLQRGL
jgi:hypothetical protein